MRAQGATEYLVLLAVVLIIALVSIALLGFFPGTVSDSQLSENKMYWRSAGPLSVELEYASYFTDYGVPYGPANALRGKITNNGPYKIQLSKIYGSGKQALAFVDQSGYTPVPLTSVTISPGESICFGDNYYCKNRMLYVLNNTASYTWDVPNIASTLCTPGGTGIFVIKDFGFEYVAFVEGQQVTKRQMGKDLMVRCS